MDKETPSIIHEPSLTSHLKLTWAWNLRRIILSGAWTVEADHNHADEMSQTIEQTGGSEEYERERRWVASIHGNGQRCYESRMQLRELVPMLEKKKFENFLKPYQAAADILRDHARYCATTHGESPRILAFVAWIRYTISQYRSRALQSIEKNGVEGLSRCSQKAVIHSSSMLERIYPETRHKEFNKSEDF